MTRRRSLRVTMAASRTYLDWNATTPPHPAVLDAVQQASARTWGNPASLHGPGREARAHVERARQALAGLLGVEARDVTLTSGGTEANNLGLESLVGAVPAVSAALLVSAIEHPSVLRKAAELAGRGVQVVRLAPQPDGVVPAEAFRAALEEQSRPVVAAALQAVNHETGVIQPVAEVIEICHARGARILVDVVQAVGKLGHRPWAGADALTMTAHKIRGPKGMGALATLPRLALRPLLYGGGQERGVRPGTQDASIAAGVAVAAELAASTPPIYRALASLRDDLERQLARVGARHGGRPRVNGTGPRIGSVCNLSWPGWSGAELCAALDLEGIAVSSGAACAAGTAEPSAVVQAMLGPERARGAVRASLGPTTTRSDLSRVVMTWDRVLERASA